jgi:hypothetical protein
MALSDADIERYARHVIVPGLGAAGQEAITRTHLLVVAAPQAERYVLAYARAAGFRITPTEEPAPACAIAAGTDALGDDARAVLRTLRCPIVWYALRGTRVIGGVLAPGDALPAPSIDEPCEIALHAPAAADAVASAVAVVLGWADVETSFDVDFGAA